MKKYARCPHCRKVYTLTKKGELPKHKRNGAKILKEVNGQMVFAGYEKEVTCEGSNEKAVNFIEGFDTNKYEVSVNGEVIYTRKADRNDYAFAIAYKSHESGKWGVKLSKNPLEPRSNTTHACYLAQVEKVEEKNIDVDQSPLAFTIVKEEPVKEEPVKEEPVKEEPAKEEPVKEEPVKEEPVNNFNYKGLTITLKEEGYNRDWKEELSFFTNFGIHEIFHRDLYLAYSLLGMVEAIIENFNLPVKQAYDMFKTGFITITKEDEPKKEEKETMIVKRLSKKQLDFLKSVSSLDFSLTENGKWIEVHNAPKLIKELENTADITPSTERRFLVQLVRKIKGLNGETVEIKTRKKRAEKKVKSQFTKAEQDLIDYCKAIKKDLKAHLQFMIKMGVSVKIANNVLSKLDDQPSKKATPKKAPVKKATPKKAPVKKAPVKKEGFEVPVFTLLPSSIQSAIKGVCFDLVQKDDMKINDSTQSLEIKAPTSVCTLLKGEILTCLDVHYEEKLEAVISMIEMELQA